jgi:hypothetical protein
VTFHLTVEGLIATLHDIARVSRYPAPAWSNFDALISPPAQKRNNASGYSVADPKGSGTEAG